MAHVMTYEQASIAVREQRSLSLTKVVNCASVIDVLAWVEVETTLNKSAAHLHKTFSHNGRINTEACKHSGTGPRFRRYFS